MKTKTTTEWTPTQSSHATRCKGTITERHTKDVAEIFDAEIAERLKNAKEGETFLNVLFQMQK